MDERVIKKLEEIIDLTNERCNDSEVIAELLWLLDQMKNM